MQEIKKRTIVIASVLKPVDDTRMASKIAGSLAGTHDVHVMGMATVRPEAQPYRCHPLPPFHRLSVARLLAPWRIYHLARRLKPQVVIITTHELLLQAWLLQREMGCRIIYDVQENYWRNILYTNSFPPVVRQVLAGWVRLKERWATHWVDHFLLAEASYAHEMPFLPRARLTVLENKVLPEAIKPRAHKPMGYQLLFTGTLATTTGVYAAIDLAVRLHAEEPRIRLHIIGFAAQPHDRRRLRALADQHHFIALTGVDVLVPHPQLVAAMAEADFGIIAYPPNAATAGAMPTKLFEYLACRLPILLVDHPVWVARCAPYSAAVCWTANTSATALLQAMTTTTYYREVPTDIYWSAEHLQQVIDAC